MFKEELKEKQERGIRDALQKALKTIKELTDNLSKKDSLLEKAQKRIDRLNEEVERLKRELSCKRGTPKWAKANLNEAEKKKRKKLGPKPGHAPNIRKRPVDIDREVNMVPRRCPGCSGPVSDPWKWHEHVQVDIPAPAKPIVTKYSMGWSYCSNCRKEVSVKDRWGRSQYGPRLHTHIVYWKFGLGLTLGKIQRLLSEEYQLHISTGQLSEMIQRVGTRFSESYQDIKDRIKEASDLHVDETGWRVDAQNHWMWSFSNSDFSYYVIDRHRGQAVVGNVLGDQFDGILSSDFYSAYNKIESQKQKCWAHVLRECREFMETYPSEADVIRYTGRLKQFFKRGIKLKSLYEKGQGIETQYRRLRTDTISFLRIKWKNTDLNRLSKRLIKHRDALYTFIKTGCDPTNNAAEREIRPAVLMRKNSYCNRSDQGAQSQAILMSVIRTYQKQNLDFTRLAPKKLTSTRI